MDRNLSYKDQKYGKGARHNDYGKGFYCTEQIELAKNGHVRNR